MKLKGFTLIEILIVVAIISILISLLYPYIKPKPKTFRSDLFITQCVDGLLVRPKTNGETEYVRDAGGETVSCPRQ